MNSDEFSLREKKYAKTKIAIMNALMARLKNERFDDISIKEICREAEIAEGTFFNYFPEKIDVIGYYLYLTTLKLIWMAKKETLAGKYLSLIDSFFSHLSDELNERNVVYQVLSVLIVQSERPKKITISDLEKKLAFPSCPRIEEVPAVMLDEWIKECVVLAINNKELPQKTNVEDVVVSLMTIMAGTFIYIRFRDSRKCAYHHMRQLKALWCGLGVNNLDKNRTRGSN